ncbi:family 16 glycosylhydrolase [Hymenobacter sp. H14-R3]|uniref:carbohydrate-binding protein n=1 Tax=Hymenobacter sp. H14-R3 TaxID=3046308 RepID=UPI0024B8B919|nr:family 16 glycosylhydrolase [Hymenobacter sp. H14-R3]MDJ0366007.1 family 16 glycosylhydrolase [Hymenobacter sp. H14-R3]
MKITFTSVLGAAALLLLGAPLASQAQTYQQVWADEFTNGISASWQFENGGGGWGNNEKQYYQPSNATVVNGQLQITARKQSVGGYAYTSSRLKTQGLKEITFGRIEARIKRPIGQGLWPAFWMLGANINSVGWPKCGEIDVMEYINTDPKTYGTAHWDSNGHAQYGQSTATTNDYHVYSVEWTPSYIRWFVDGTKYNELNIAGGTGSTEEFQRPFFLLLNLAVAGDWPGQTVDESKLPATMYVDYVRVYQLTNAPAASSVTLQAEAANVNNGMVVEACSEGGQDMGYIDAGDYLVWNNVNFPTSGAYTIEYRVASGASGGTISADLNAGSVQLGSSTLPGTGGWQTWTTVSKTVNVSAGTYNFGIYAQTGGYNLNWVRISKASGAREATALATTSAGSPASATLYPNPVAANERLQTEPELVGSTYQVLDALGRVAGQGTLSASGLEVSALRPGRYVLLLTTPTQQRVSRTFSKQ